MSGKITGGTVRISQKKQVADYEPREVTVELHFAVEEGRDADPTLDHVSDLANRKVAELLGTKPAGVVPTGTKGAGTKEAAAASMNAADATKMAKPPRATKKTAEAPKGDELPDDPPAETKKAEAPPADDLSDLGIETPKPTIAEITDAILLSKITAHAGKTKNAPAIRALIGKQFDAPDGKQAKDIPQEKRQSFLVELEKIGAP